MLGWLSYRISFDTVVLNSKGFLSYQRVKGFLVKDSRGLLCRKAMGPTCRTVRGNCLIGKQWKEKWTVVHDCKGISEHDSRGDCHTGPQQRL